MCSPQVLIPPMFRFNTGPWRCTFFNIKNMDMRPEKGQHIVLISESLLQFHVNKKSFLKKFFWKIVRNKMLKAPNLVIPIFALDIKHCNYHHNIFPMRLLILDITTPMILLLFKISWGHYKFSKSYCLSLWIRYRSDPAKYTLTGSLRTRVSYKIL